VNAVFKLKHNLSKESKPQDFAEVFIPFKERKKVKVRKRVIFGDKLHQVQELQILGTDKDAYCDTDDCSATAPISGHSSKYFDTDKDNYGDADGCSATASVSEHTSK